MDTLYDDVFDFIGIEGRVYKYKTKGGKEFLITSDKDSHLFSISFPGQGNFPLALKGLFTDVKKAELECYKYFQRQRPNDDKLSPERLAKAQKNRAKSEEQQVA